MAQIVLRSFHHHARVTTTTTSATATATPTTTSNYHYYNGTETNFGFPSTPTNYHYYNGTETNFDFPSTPTPTFLLPLATPPLLPPPTPNNPPPHHIRPPTRYFTTFLAGERLHQRGQVCRLLHHNSFSDKCGTRKNAKNNGSITPIEQICTSF